jgi:acyl carrier protein
MEAAGGILKSGNLPARSENINYWPEACLDAVGNRWHLFGIGSPAAGEERSEAMALDARLQQVVATVFGVEPADVTMDDSPESIAAWDSVNHIQLILALEAEYGVRFDPGELADLMSVAAVHHRLRNNGAD